MTTIEVSVKIKSRLNEVYKLIKNMEDFPNFMRDIKALKIIKRMDNKVITLWEVEVEGAALNWKEEDAFDDASYQMKFTLLEGNYKAYHGLWWLENQHGRVKLGLKAYFDWGIPILEKYVGSALEEKARHSLLGMLQAIKNKAEKANV